MSTLSGLTPGEWYLIVDCENCKTKHPLFRDLSHGESRIQGTYKWTCPDCGCEGSCDSVEVERYHHEAH